MEVSITTSKIISEDEKKDEEMRFLSIPSSAESPAIRLFGSWWPRQRRR